VSGISLTFLLGLASRLGSDSVGDVNTGLLGLVQLAGTRPSQWLLIRIVQMWIGYVSVWIVRIPVLAFVFTLGGIRLETMLITELAMAVNFLALSSLALLLSFNAQTRRHVNGRVVLLLFVWNALLVLPAAVASSLSVFWPWLFPVPLVDALQWIASFSLSSQFFMSTSAMPALEELWPGLVLYGAIGVALLARFWRMVVRFGTMTSEDRVGPTPDTTGVPQRVSRRCWDDALAWQAFVFVGRGNRMVRAKAVGYVMLGILVWLAVEYGYEILAMLMLPILCGGLMMNAINKSGECLTRELNDKTIGTLLMTPHNYDELTAGWRRGSWRLAAPDLVLWGLMTAASALVHINVPPVMVCIAMVLVASQHFFILSPLMPFSFAGVTSGVALIFAFIVMAAVCSFAAMLIHPWAAPVVLAPLLWGFVVLLKRVLPYWIDRKLTSVL
jgi:hypothetical protein